MCLPPEMWSMVRAASATRWGLRYELQSTNAPNSMCCVTSATAASRAMASKFVPFGGPVIG